jgi:SAM-dependent methyltransferase
MTTAATTPLASAKPGDSPMVGQYERSYNLLPPTHRDGFFMELVVDVAHTYPRPRRVLDIGCGHGVGTDEALFNPIRSAADEFWGVEPDTSITPPPGVFTNFQHALFEDAAIPDNSIDIAYSCMVMEHVQDPGRFMARVHRVLKPGGTYIFLTVNGDHYFARIANAMRKLKVDEAVLRIARPSEVVEGYHYPTAYKFNKPRQIEKSCRELGFEPPRFVFTEHDARAYFPGPTKLFWHALTAKRRVIRNPRSLLELIGVIRKPA